MYGRASRVRARATTHPAARPYVVNVTVNQPNGSPAR